MGTDLVSQPHVLLPQQEELSLEGSYLCLLWVQLHSTQK